MLIKNDDEPSGLGYYVIDQRGTGIPVSVGKALFEADTYTCTHCGTVVVLNPERKRPRYKCTGCNHHICDPCAARKATGEKCRTLLQLIDEQFQAQALRQAGDESVILPLLTGA